MRYLNFLVGGAMLLAWVGVSNATPIAFNWTNDSVDVGDVRLTAHSLEPGVFSSKSPFEHWYIQGSITIGDSLSLSVNYVLGRHLDSYHSNEIEPGFDMNICCDNWGDMNNRLRTIPIPAATSSTWVLHDAPRQKPKHIDLMTATLSDLDPHTSSYLSLGGAFQFDIHLEHTNKAAVPEPSTLLLLGTGLMGLIGYGHRRRAA